MKKIPFLSLVLILILGTTSAKADTVTNLTIYGNSPQTWDMPYYYMPHGNTPGYAVISFVRQVSLESGTNAVIVDKVPDEADPSSIMVKGLGRNMQVVEQNFVSSGLAVADIIKRNIGKEVEVEKYTGDGVVTIKGVLLDSSSGLIIRDGDKLKLLNDYSSVTVRDEEGSTAAGNYIKWLVSSTSSGSALFEYSYKTQGITWSAMYNVYLDGKGTDVMAKVDSWANLVNSTNININETNLKLVAGEVAQEGGGRGYPVPMMAKMGGGAEMAMDAAAPASQEKFSDYHMYTMDRKVSLPATSSKKIKLFADKDGVLARRKYVFDAAQSGDNSVKSVITFTNDEKSRLGIPLPGGKYRVFEKDSSGAFEQVGETTQQHKAEGEKVELTIGNAFDLKARREQVDTEQDQLRHRGKYTVKVEIESALEDDVDVIVKEPIYQQNWQIVDANFTYAKINANMVEFTVHAKPKAKTRLQYVVEYSW